MFCGVWCVTDQWQEFGQLSTTWKSWTLTEVSSAAVMVYYDVLCYRIFEPVNGFLHMVERRNANTM